MVGKARDWFPNDKATNEWLNSMKKSSRHTYQSQWKNFLKFTGMTGDQILANRKTDKDYAWEKKIIEFRQWLIEKKGLSENTAKTAGGTVRSFFAYYRVELQLRRTESTKLAEARRKTEDYRFSRDDLKKMADFSDLEEEYVVVVGKSFGLRAGDFLKLSRGDLEAYIDREPPISIGEYSTQKESVPAYPFVDSDAKPVIKRMLENMKREGRTSPNDRMLIYKDTIQLTRVLKRVAERAGVKHGNKRVRFHCLRKFLIDRLSDVMSSEKWKQIVGKTISESAYVSPDKLREDYQRAMTETCFTEPISTEEVELRVVKKLLEGQLKAAGLDPKKILRVKKCKTTAEEVIALQEALEKKRGAIGGGLPFELQARKALADILVGAIQDAKKRLAEKS